MNDIINLNKDFVLPGGITIHDAFWVFKGDDIPRFLSSPPPPLDRGISFKCLFWNTND